MNKILWIWRLFYIIHAMEWNFSTTYGSRGSRGKKFFLTSFWRSIATEQSWWKLKRIINNSKGRQNAQQLLTMKKREFFKLLRRIYGAFGCAWWKNKARFDCLHENRMKYCVARGHRSETLSPMYLILDEFLADLCFCIRSKKLETIFAAMSPSGETCSVHVSYLFYSHPADFWPN